MDLDTFVILVSFVLLVVSGIVYRYSTENVRLTYVDQRIPEEVKK